MSDDLVKRLRMVTGFIRFETGDRIAASACLSEEAAGRIEELEAKLAKAVDVIAWALSAWDDHNKYGDAMQGDWVYDARAAIAEINGGGDT